MLKKSALLEYLLKKADEIKAKDEKKALTSNYFLISLLELLHKKKTSNLPTEVKNMGCSGEIEAVEKLLSTYGISYDVARAGIDSFIHKSGYNSSIDEFVFGKFYYSAEGKAKGLGKTEIDTEVYLLLVIAEPSDAIKKEIIGEVKTPEATSTASAPSWDSLFGDGRKESPTEQEEKPEGKAEEKAEEVKEEAPQSSIDKLARTVSDTKDIQKNLLDKIYGQDQAINTFVSGYFQSELIGCVQKENHKPATFLFAGPPGVGKTYLAEVAAKALGRPFMRFDMSEYSDNESGVDICGSNGIYKNAKPGTVTGFVKKNPRCVLLFDEIEKAHINVIHLFLQLLDAGRLRDNHLNEEISFADAVVIFTTNVGKNLYNDPTVTNLSSIPRKKVLNALATDVDPATGVRLFPAAICSRFASGNVIMFNHLDASNLYTIAKREIDSDAKTFSDATEIKVSIDHKVPTAIMLSEGGRADARTVKGRAAAFFHEELYELLRLASGENGEDTVRKLREIEVCVDIDTEDEDISKLFVNSAKPEILIFAEKAMATKCKKKLTNVVVHTAERIDEAKEILFNHDISLVVCDVNCKKKPGKTDVLNAEDIISEGHDFLVYVLARYTLPVYILEDNVGDISEEEYLSFAKMGVRDVISASAKKADFEARLIEKCNVAYQQCNMNKLARENKVLFYKTAQTLSEDGAVAQIKLFDFRLTLATDVSDGKSVLDNVSKPNVKFSDVIGAEDAKGELSYFVEFLKSPIEYMRKGVRAPKGVLLYGPPGTGKTMLAKAMAGESEVTFLTAEGNQFLKKYVGEGPEAVHAIFNAARKYAPSILFIDEIDAIGKSRNSETNRASADVLTAFLTEMDGFNTDTSKPVFVLAATNFDVDPNSSRALDPALLRRFDRRIYVDLPNKDERRRFLEMKIAKSPNINLSREQIENIAMRSTGMSLAELDSIFEMALRNAIRTKTGVVDDASFDEAFETFNGGEKKEWSPDTLERTARHEAGHALLCWLGGEKPSYLTIVARGDHGGYMQHSDNEDKALYTREELFSRIRTSLGGRASEIVYYGDEDGISTGASADLKSATRTAELMICCYGMDKDVGLSYVGLEGANTPEIRARVNGVLSHQLDLTIEAVRKNKVAIDKIVTALLEKNHLKENEIDEIFKKYAKA